MQMDAVKIYEGYFKKKTEEIGQILSYYREQGKKITLWGAGKKGLGFLKAFDSENKLISCVYDKDVSRVGQRMESGHIIVDYRKEESDLVLVANSVFELEVIHLLKSVGSVAKVINLDNVILGDLKVQDVTDGCGMDLTGVRKSRICAVTVLYQPDMEVVENIKSYANEIEKIFLYDNSENVKVEVVEKLLNLPNVEYVSRRENMGLPVVFNEAAEAARKQGFDWMITFDQDSMAEKGMVSAMREYADSAACRRDTAVIAPVVNEIDNRRETQDIYSTYCDKVIQSGAMHHLAIMEKVGGYDENMFIDEVDNEYCARCIVQGYKIIKLNNALLMHNQQDAAVEKKFVEGTTVFINKFSPDRYYYRYRNALYCHDLYKETYPLYGLDCLNTIRKMKLQLEYDVDREDNRRAVEQAIDDYRKGIMGKRGHLK